MLQSAGDHKVRQRPRVDLAVDEGEAGPTKQVSSEKG